MEQKDPKDMTAAELLRLADSHPCSMCHLVMAGDESCATTGCASWAYRLADKIDAELAQARELSLRAGAELWAKANGYPDFKQGEDFGAWLDRCAIPRPRFEDGEPVQFGELVSSNLFGAVKVSAIELTADGTHVKDEPDGDWSTSLEVTTSRLKRPAPEVLGADGKPIKVGETVYVTDSGIERTVKNFGTKLCEGMDGWDGSPWVMFGNGSWMHARDLTHTPPDTQERIDKDTRLSSVAYWKCNGIPCRICPAAIDGENPAKWYGVRTCGHAMFLDLLRRQRELDARKGGDAR